MLRALGLALLVLGGPTLARAQPQVEPEQDEVVRWAAREIGRADGRALGGHPPVPPDSYLRSEEGSLPPRGDGDVAARLLAELGGGTLGLFVGAGVGGLLVLAALDAGANPDVLALSVGAAVALGSLGVSAGVTLAADLMGGAGNFGHAFLGQMLGSAVALPLVVLAMSNDAPAAALAAAGLLPLAGATLGYEVGHAERATQLTPSATVAPTLGGAVAMLAVPLP